MKNPNPSFDQLIPLDRLQTVLRRFSVSAAMGCRIVDAHGEVVFASDWEAPQYAVTT
jgi:hypothetical protein